MLNIGNENEHSCLGLPCVCLYMCMHLVRFGHCFTFWHWARCSRFILYILYHSPRISHLLKEPWFLLLENDMTNQDLAIRCACHRWFMFERWTSLAFRLWVLLKCKVLLHIARFDGPIIFLRIVGLCSWWILVSSSEFGIRIMLSS